MKVEEQQTQQNVPEESNPESAPNAGHGKAVMNEDELHSPVSISLFLFFDNLILTVRKMG